MSSNQKRFTKGIFQTFRRVHPPCQRSRLIVMRLALCLVFILSLGGCTKPLPSEPEHNQPAQNVPGDEPVEKPKEKPTPGDTKNKPDERPQDPPTQEHPDQDPPEQDFEEPDEPTGIVVEAIVPSKGYLSGTTHISIVGKRFTPKTRVFFGSQEASLELIGDTLVGFAPHGARPGPVDVRFFEETAETLEEKLVEKNAFTYYDQVTVRDVRPNSIPYDGRTKVFITGNGFTPHTSVSFGKEEALNVEFIDEQNLFVTAPPYGVNAVEHALSPTSLSQSLPLSIVTENESYSAREAIRYYLPAKIEELYPAEGDFQPPTVELKGYGFSKEMSVYFGSQVAQVDSISTDGTTAVVQPPHASHEGFVNVRVETSVDAAIVTDAFYYRDPQAAELPLNIKRITPDLGPTTGGTRVYMSGVGIANASKVTMGGQIAKIVDKGPGYLVVETPAVAQPGKVAILISVTAANAEQKVFELEHKYQYVTDVGVVSVSPQMGPAAGGETIVVKGKGFDTITSVSLGGLEVPFVIVDTETIEITTRPYRPGMVDLELSVDSYVYTVENAYEFTDSLELNALRPTRGSVGGGTQVEILGAGFTSDVKVTFGEKEARVIEQLGSHRLLVESPSHAEGLVDVTVSRAEGNSEDDKKVKQGAFEYYNPALQGGGTSGGPIEGAVNVVVYSTSGIPVQKALVMLSGRQDSPYVGVTNASGFVTLSGPDVYGEQTVNVSAFGYSSISLQSVNAKNITVLLELLPRYYETPSGEVKDSNVDPPPPPPPEDEDPPAGSGSGSGSSGSSGSTPPQKELSQPVVQGNLYGLDKLGIPGPDEILRGYVFTTQVDPYTYNPDPGPKSILARSGPYEITTRTGDMAIIALGGLFNTKTHVFRPIAMAIERYVTMALGETKTFDLTLDIPTNTTMQIKVNSKPSVCNFMRLQPWIHLGYEGVFNTFTSQPSTQTILQLPNQPNISRDLPGASYSFEAGAYQNPNRYSVPRSVSFLSNVTTQSGIISLPGLFGVATITNSHDLLYGSGYGKTVHFELDSSAHEPDVFLIRIVGDRNITLWEVTIPGNMRSFQLPNLPNIPGLPADQQPDPYPAGEYQLNIFGVKKQNFDYSSMVYNRLLGRKDLIGYSVSISRIRFSRVVP